MVVLGSIPQHPRDVPEINGIARPPAAAPSRVFAPTVTYQAAPPALVLDYPGNHDPDGGLAHYKACCLAQDVTALIMKAGGSHKSAQASLENMSPGEPMTSADGVAIVRFIVPLP